MRFPLLPAILVTAMLPAQTPPGTLSLPELRNPEIKPPEKDPAATKPEEPKKALLAYEGKPLEAPFVCTEEDIQAFGMTCTADDPCPVYVELTGVQPVGNKIFLSGNFHNGASTMYSLLLASDDEGKTWSEPTERIRNAGLDQIHFLDFAHGWISGHVLTAVPRDPFFLVTGDGGKTWRRSNIYGEPGPGLIEQFWFETAERGMVVVDRQQADDSGGRYLRYETMTGADNWMIRELSTKPIRLKAAAGAPNSEWRLRTDPKNGAHVLERRAGNRFQTVAAFAVRSASCQPEFKPLQEPPPPQVTPEQPKPARPASPRGPKPRPTLKDKP